MKRIGLVLALICTPALAHEAEPTPKQPLGWTYPFSCCSGIDCRQVTNGKNGIVREEAGGYVIAKTGEKIIYGDTRIKDSPDGEFHWCSVAGADDSRTLCLFVPPRAF